MKPKTIIVTLLKKGKGFVVEVVKDPRIRTLEYISMLEIAKHQVLQSGKTE